ncbi:MAG: DNA translocase FtsK, partial [Chloroflexota bacterium]
ATSGLPAPAAKPPVPASPLKSPTSAFARPEDDLDDDDEIEDDELDDMDDSEDLSTLPPAQPKGFGEPLPRHQTSRFGATTFNASNKSADAPDRMGRLNEIRQGGAPVSAPKPDESPANKPNTPMSQPAAASAAPANGDSSTLSSFRRPGGPPSNPSSAFGKPSTPPPTSTPNRPVMPPAADGNKAPQPAAAFWKDTPAASVATPAKTYEPEKSETPRPKVEPAAASYGKPPDPAGVTINPYGREGMASAALTSPPPPPAHTAAAAVPDATPIGRAPEIPVRQAGVGTTAPVNVPRKRKEWRMPSISQVLMPGSENDFDRTELLRRAHKIEETLQSFGAPGKVVEVNTGPVITQFGVEPDYLVNRSGKKNRVKVGAIAQLDKDLQLALGAKSIRIEAPVPGKGYVGIEVPNDQPSVVSLRDVMESDQFKKLYNKSPLAIALGQSVDGTPISADLASMPHLLIAGTTGSGKSVCVNAIITSLIAMNPPDKVKFIMVDPKRVELTGYNGIPHLVAPVVVELERIVGVLKWVTREMDERYKKFSLAGARNIEDYNKHQGDGESLPYIVVIIDELADLMMLAPDETERVITRIAALARATGIHLVIATQRPSVDVVTGLIKANFPARIAFAVAGGVDSRVILDQPGAERLLGKGDMLYMSGDAPAAVRLQGVYVSDQEIQNITRYWKSQITAEDTAARPINALVVDNTVVEPSRSVIEGNERTQAQQAFWDTDMKQGSGGSGGSTSREDEVAEDQEDVLYEEAVDMVRRLGKASVSLLQRRLRIGYTRSARLIDRMEEEGIIGPAVEGAKPREVLTMK